MHLKTFENYKDIYPHNFMDLYYIQSILFKNRIENYKINPDGSIDVDGNVNIYDNTLYKIPIKFREVSGDFRCSHIDNLNSLEGCPERVGGDFYCSGNSLTTLQFSPKRVGGDFYCSFNYIWTFEDFNTSIGGGFNCTGNPIFQIWKLFYNTEKFDLLNEIDAIRPGKVIIMDRLNEFLIMIGKEPVQNVRGYKCI